MAVPPRPAKGRKRIRRGPGQQIIGGRDFRLADEVRSIQRQAANQHGRIVTVGQLILFSTETGDAWLIDPADRLAARLARDGESKPIHIEETDTTFAIGWKGRYRIEGPAFVYADNDSGRVTTILGYPTDQLAQIGCLGNFKIFWLDSSPENRRQEESNNLEGSGGEEIEDLLNGLVGAVVGGFKFAGGLVRRVGGGLKAAIGGGGP